MILEYLDGNAFQCFYNSFVFDESISDDGKLDEVKMQGFLKRFNPQEQRKVLSATALEERLSWSHLRSSIRTLHAA